MKILYTRPLTTPSTLTLPSGFEQAASESDLSHDFSRRYPWLKARSDLLARLALALRLLSRRRNYEVVVTGRYGEWFCLLQKLLPFGRRPHLLLDIEWYQTRNDIWRKLLNRWLNRSIVSGATRIQVFCAIEARNYARYFGIDEAKFLWIPYCTDEGAGLPAQEPGNYILSSGFHQRDYETLFQAVRDLPLELRIVARPAQFAGMSIPDNVRILGIQTAEEYRYTLLRARFLVLSLDPTVIRRPGVITYVTAMRMGKCVVVNDPAGAASYIEDGQTGFLVHPNDPTQLRERILALWNDPDITRRIASNARQAAETQFSLKRYSTSLEQAVLQTVRSYLVGAE